MLVYLFVVLLAIASAASNEHFVVDILEHGTLVKQEITLKDGLQIIHVPAHRDLEEVELYIDFKNDFQLVKLIDENKCQLSKIDPGTKPLLPNLNHRQDAPLDSSSMKHKRIVRLENNEPLSDISHLHQEMQKACHSLPIFWVDAVEEELYYSKRSSRTVLTTDMNKYRLSSDKGDILNCPYEGGYIGSNAACHPNCFYQLCNPNGGKWCYYTAVHCPLVTPSCWEHLNNIPLNCRPCCSSRNITCNGAFKYCGCYENNPIGK